MRMLFLLLTLCLHLSLSAEELTHTGEPLADIRAALSAGSAVLVDVREEAEWKRGYVKGALKAPTSTLSKKDGAILATIPKDKPVYLYCRSGGRALNMAKLLRAEGYDARALPNGYDELITAGFEGEK
jgi:rhodanese-related sulfurtransferase